MPAAALLRDLVGGTEDGRVRPIGLLPMLSWFAGEIGGAHGALARHEASAPLARPIDAGHAVHASPTDLATTIEVPAMPPARRGLAGIAARLASAGAVPAGLAALARPNGLASHVPVDEDMTSDDVAATMAMPAIPRPTWADPIIAPPLTPAFPTLPIASPDDRPNIVPHAVPGPDDVLTSDPAMAAGSTDAGDVPTRGALRERLVRAAVSAGLVVAALGAGAWAGRAAILATAARWQPSDASATETSVRPVRGRGMSDADYRALYQDLQREAARDRERDAVREDSLFSSGDVSPDDEMPDDPPRPPSDGELRFDTIHVPTPPDGADDRSAP